MAILHHDTQDGDNGWISYIQECFEDGSTEEDSFSDMMSVTDIGIPEEVKIMNKPFEEE